MLLGVSISIAILNPHFFDHRQNISISREQAAIKFAIVLLCWSVLLGQPGFIYTFAGQKNYFGDGGAATAAILSSPQGIALSTTGDIYIADSINYGVRKVPKPYQIGICGDFLRGYGFVAGVVVWAHHHRRGRPRHTGLHWGWRPRFRCSADQSFWCGHDHLGGLLHCR